MPKILITGANGWIGYNAKIALSEYGYDLILVDKQQGKDLNNRFGIEQSDFNSPEFTLTKIDLAKEREAFAKLISDTKPDCVIHLAGVLENQTIETIRNNLTINKNVLEVCAEHKIALIAASSIMVMYGAAMHDEKISKIFKKELITLTEDEKLTVDTPLKNTPQTIQQYDADNWPNNLEYIRGKEELEKLAKQLVSSNYGLTIIAVRFGWSGVKNPYELEGDKQITEIPGYLCQEDLQSFIVKAVQAVLSESEKVTGYKCYAPISIHPQNWLSVQNAEYELGWIPSINTAEKHQSSHATISLKNA